MKPKSRASPRPQGFTAPEFLIAAAIGALIIGTVVVLSLYSGRSFAALGNYVELDMTSRNALDHMLRELRQAKNLIGYTTNSITFTGFTNQVLNYTWNPDSQELRRSINGVED